MKKTIMITMGMILLISLVSALAFQDKIISIDSLKKDKLSEIGIDNPTITQCEKLDDSICESSIYQKGGINKKIQITTRYCDEYVFEQVNETCAVYQNNTEQQCDEQLVYENVCRDVITQDCSWKPFENLWGYTCENITENVCSDEIAQICNPYMEEQCNYENVYEEVCEEVQVGEDCIEVEIKDLKDTGEELFEKEYETIYTPIMETQCHDVLNDYKSKVCEEVEIANCTNKYETVCKDIVIDQTCIEYEENLVKTNDCSIWKELSQSEIEEELLSKSKTLLEEIATVQETRTKAKELLTDELLIEIKENKVEILKG